MASQLRSELLDLYSPPTCGDGPCEDLFPQFICFVLVPCAIVLLLCVFLSWIMCCKSSKCRKSKVADQTNDVQLETYNTIRRASAGLRYMSQHRETALMGSRAGSAMTLERPQRRPPRNRDSCYSAPGTLQRQHRQRHAEHSQNKDLAPSYSGTEHPPGSWRSNRNRYSDQPMAPPPPAYSSLADDVLPGAELLLSERSSSGVRYQSVAGPDDCQQ